MLIAPVPQQTHDAIDGITKNVAANCLVEDVVKDDPTNPLLVVEALQRYFKSASTQQYITLASMDRNKDVLSIAQVLLDTVAAVAMPRPKFENLKITAEEKHTVEASFRECQRALQQLSTRLFSYNAKLAQNTPVKNTEITDCLAGLLIGYLSKEPKPVE